MAIVFHCKCGRPLRANPESAGKRTKCPGCEQILTIPGGPEKPANAATPNAPAAEEDPFALALDWSTLESPRTPEADGQRSSSGVIKIDASQADVATADMPRTEDGSRQYRVLTQKDQGFTGKFNPVKLEEILNAHARNGWAVKAAFAMNVPSHGHGGSHDEMIVILER